MKVPPGVGVVGWVAAQKSPVVVNDPQRDARHDLFIAEKIGVPARNLVAAPLLHAQSGDDQALGAFEVLNKRSGSFTDEDLKLLTLIAGQAAKAIVLARNRDDRVTSERLASVGQMMSGVLHDLKTPMTIASGYAQLMAASDEPDTRERYASMIVKQFDLMAGMTREVLLFARGESNLLVRKQFLHAFIETIKQQLERELSARKVRLIVEPRFVGAAYFDEHKMFRVVHNLARNAAQAMTDGGTFTVAVDSDGADLILTFTDTGPGIPEAVRGRLFTAFATAGKEDGTGLGLAIVKKIVDEHAGRIHWDSRPGAGTSFKITLPLNRPEPSGAFKIAE
jgi:signal transduction histidine kinase